MYNTYKSNSFTLVLIYGLGQHLNLKPEVRRTHESFFVGNYLLEENLNWVIKKFWINLMKATITKKNRQLKQFRRHYQGPRNVAQHLKHGDRENIVTPI